MSRMLRTNELIVDFDYKILDDKYVFYCVSTSEAYIKGGASFLDFNNVTYVRAIAYEMGKSFYMMLDINKITRSEVIELLNRYEDGDSLSISLKKSREVPDHILLQLLLNSISNPEDEICSYNNLSGKLLCYRPKWIDKDKEGTIWGLTCLEIRVDKSMRLHMNAHRMTSLRMKNKMKFGKRKLCDYPQYEFSYNNHTLRRVSNEKINDNSNLIQKPVDGEKGGISFFDFKDFETFECTKNGILYELLHIIRKQYGDLMKISFNEYELEKSYEYSRTVLEQYKQVVEKTLVQNGIVLIDEVKSSTSVDYLKDICDEIHNLMPEVKCSVGKRLSKKKLNIRYIHDKQFYDEDDPYQDDLRGYVVQHITVENFQHDAKAAVYNVLKELVVKHDLKERKISLVNWQNYEYQDDWIFGTVIDKEFYFMTVHPDGTFEIRQMQRNLFNMTEYDKYMDCFGVYSENSKKTNVIGIIKDFVGNINVIKNTHIYTMPEFEKTGELLQKASEEIEMTGSKLRTWFERFLEECQDLKIREDVHGALDKIDVNKTYHKIEVVNLFKGMKTKKNFTRYLHEHTDVVMHTYLRDEESRHHYFTGIVDINCFDKTESKLKYCVGEIGAGMKYTVERASIVREVEALEGSDLIFEDLLPLMGVEFVRYGMLTVMPFAFKYLTEWGRMHADI